jgi:glucose-1-phosphate thymidylyltransferase
MKALILAAGFSTRLYPLTENFPKGLLEVNGKPIISYLLDELVKLPEIDETALVTNQRVYSHYQKFIAENDDYFHITLVNNEVEKKDQRLGAIGDLLYSLDVLGWDDDLLVIPSDTLVSLDLKKLLDFYKRKKTFVNVVYDAGDKEIIKGKLGCAEVQGDKLVGFEEKPADPKSTWQSVPIYVYPQKTLNLIRKYAQDKSNNLDSPGAIIPYLLKYVPISAYKMKDGFYYDVGTHQILEDLQKSFKG